MPDRLDRNVTQNFTEAIGYRWLETTDIGVWAGSTVLQIKPAAAAGSKRVISGAIGFVEQYNLQWREADLLCCQMALWPARR